MSSNQPDKPYILQDIIEPMKTILEDKVEFALLFGSAVTGRITSESDIDIGVFFKDPNISFDKYLDFKDALSTSCHREVDLINMNTSDIIITMQILANGSLLINNNPGHFVLYKAQKIGEYIDFKMDRKIIEENLLRGRIYA
jgi:predicted nucleotidyltransferase